MWFQRPVAGPFQRNPLAEILLAAPRLLHYSHRVTLILRKNDLAFNRALRQELDGLPCFKKGKGVIDPLISHTFPLLDGLPCFKKGKGVGDERVNLVFCEQREDLGQILSERLWVFPVERGNAVEVAAPATQACAEK